MAGRKCKAVSSRRRISPLSLAIYDRGHPGLPCRARHKEGGRLAESECPVEGICRQRRTVPDLTHERDSEQHSYPRPLLITTSIFQRLLLHLNAQPRALFSRPVGGLYNPITACFQPSRTGWHSQMRLARTLGDAGGPR